MAHPSTSVVYSQVTIYAIIILLILGWTAVSLRLWVRLRITKSPGLDDATMVLTLLLFTCYSSFILVIIARATAAHTPSAVLETLLFVQLGEVFYILTTTALKISLGLFFMRVLTKRWQLNVFRTTLAISAAYGFFYVCIVLFQCGSPNKLAFGLLRSKKCLPPKLLLSTGSIYGIINVLADWTFVLIPIFILVESDMDRQAKISVSIVMALGAIGSISSILRMVYLQGLQLQNGTVSNNTVKATLWATAEPGTGIVAASIAILRPLFRNIKSGVRDKLSEYSASKSSRSAATTAGDGTQIGKDNEAIIPLTLVPTSEHADPRDYDAKKPRTSMYSIRSPTGDPWDTDVEVQQAHVGQVIHVRMKSGPPTPRRNRNDEDICAGCNYSIGGMHNG